VLYPIELLARASEGRPGLIVAGRSDECQIFAAKQSDDGLKRLGPGAIGGVVIGAEGFDVEADAEAFLRASEIDQSGAENAV
jgi:hypothetical protein